MTTEPLSHEDAKKKHGPSNVERTLTKENARLTGVIKNLRTKAGSNEWLVEEIGKRINAMGVLPEIDRAHRTKAAKAYDRELEATLIIADPHMEEVVDARETEGLAEWNFNRFLRSAWQTIEATTTITNFMRAHHKIKKLNLLFMGDMVTGEIHTDVFFTNEMYLPDALTAGPWYWSQFVRELSAHFDEVSCVGIRGNHGRLDLKPTSKRAVGRNWDTCMYQNTAVQTANLENVSWFIPRSPKCVVEINGWYFLLQHGDQVAQHGGTMPYYGMARQRSSETAKRLGLKVRDVAKRLEEGLLFDYDVRGHSHIYGTVEERTLLCPSMMGNNEFGLNTSFAHKTPGARLFFVDNEHGMAGDWRINLSELKKEHRFEMLPGWAH